MGQIAQLNSTGAVPYADLVPLRQPWPRSLQWAAWGPTMWRFFKAWAVVRITGGFPLPHWGLGDVALVFPHCCLCGRGFVDVAHLLAACPGTARYRAGLPAASLANVSLWCLGCPGAPDELRVRVMFLGLCCSAFMRARRAEMTGAVRAGTSAGAP